MAVNKKLVDRGTRSKRDSHWHTYTHWLVGSIEPSSNLFTQTQTHTVLAPPQPLVARRTHAVHDSHRRPRPAGRRLRRALPGSCGSCGNP